MMLPLPRYGHGTRGNVMARSVLALLLLALAGAAAAQSPAFRYSFIEASYSKADYDNLDLDGDGLGLAASVALSDNFFVFGSYAGAEVGETADTDGWRAGAGLHLPLSRLMDAVAQLTYQSTEVSVPSGGTVDDDGFGVRAGLRVGANEWIELNGGLTYLDLDSGNETLFDAGFLLNLAGGFAVGVGGSWGDEVSAFSLNGRLYFQ